MPSTTPKRKGNRNVINFRNTGTSEWNDVVHNEVFDLENNDYIFTIEPNTNFWRFGLRLFNSIEIPFSSNSRHNELNIDIHLAVGTWYKAENRWENANRIELGQYNIKSIDHIIDRFDEYKSLNKVEFSVGRDSADVLNVVYKTGQHRISRNIPLSSQLRYFKIFVWADMIDFDLDCIIKVKKKITPDKTPSKTNSRQYWFLKLSPDSWDIVNLVKGAQTWFGSHNPRSGQPRPEYDLFVQVGKDDLVLGYSVSHESIVCVFRVSQVMHNDRGKGEIISLVVQEQLSPFIPRKNFAELVSFVNDLDVDSILRLFLLSYDTFQLILQSVSGQKSFRDDYDPNFIPEGNFGDTEDQLQFTNDIESFATVISLKEIEPPLAIGLFGNWGSGKSFFMKKLKKQIEINCDSQESKYAKNIVQVEFNSWHYSDANLWASLTTQIFESLNDFAIDKKYGEKQVQEILKKLGITTLQIDETQKQIDNTLLEVDKLSIEKEEIEKTVREKKETLKMWEAKDFVRIVFEDPNIKSDFEGLKEEFKNEKLIENLTELDARYTEVKNAAGRIYESIRLFWNNKKGKWWIVWIIFFATIIMITLLSGPLKPILDSFTRLAVQITSGLIVLTGVITKLAPYFRKISLFYKRLRSLKETIEKEKQIARFREVEEVDRLKSDIEKLTAKTGLLEKEKTVKENERQQLQSHISDIASGKHLINFLAEKSIDDNYIRQLGIISWIRRDFSKLNDLFVQQAEAQKENEQLENKPMRIDRIVLYIDDLDRCNEDTVVKVLESIHLLLAFKLFVVVVGVDPRWLDNALTEKYKGLFGKKEIDHEKNNNKADTKLDEEKYLIYHESASSYDYLEKIFQIPFALRPINKEGREDLLSYLVRNELEESESSPDQSTKKEETTQGSSESPKQNDGGSSTKSNDNSGDKTPNTKATHLTFSSEELKFMQEISSLFGHTPRTINRYVNIYRIVKAHKSFNPEGTFTESDFRAAMFGIAIIVGYPKYAERFIKDISKSNDITIDKFFKGKHLPEFITKIIRGNIRQQVLASITPSMIRKNLDLIARFSFRPIQLER